MALYGPVVYSRCRAAGVPAQDVADVGQEVFCEVLKGITGFRRDRPGDTFRGWLVRITQRRVADYWRRRLNSPEGTAAGGSGVLERLAEVPGPCHGGPLSGPDPSATAMESGPPTAEEAAEADDLRHRALRLIAARFETRTWQACWLVVMEARPIEVVAQELGMTVNAVRVAKSRVLTCLREEFGDLLD